jgi:predicted PurR-regulated permease PerM
MTSTRTRAKQTAPHAAWSSRDILRAAALVATVYLALQLLWVGRSVFFLGFLGVLLGLTLAAAVDRLQRFGLPRGIGAILIVLTVAGTLTGLGALTAPRLAGQLRELQVQLPQAITSVERWLEQREGRMTELLQEKSDSTESRREKAPADGRDTQVNIRRSLTEQVSGVGRHFFAFFSSTLAVLAGMLLVAFTAIFVAVDPGLYHSGLMHLFPHRSRARAGEVLSAMAITLRRWFVTQLIGMLAIGSVTTVVLLLLQVKAAVALGIIAGILEFVPYVGPILSAVPALAMALVDGPEKALWVAAAYIVIQQVEGHLLVPLLMKEGLELPPVLTIFSQALMSLVFGFLGLLVAVPLLGAVMVPIKMLYVRDVVGDQVTLPGEDKEDDSG